MTDDVDLALPRPAAPSPTQSHGTVMVALLSGFVVLAILLWLSVRDVGPFPASVVSQRPLPDGKAAVTVSIRNDGKKAGHGKCRLARVSPNGDREPDFEFISDRVPPHQQVTQTIEVPLREGSAVGQLTC